MRKNVEMLVLIASMGVLICLLSGCLLRDTGGTDNPLEETTLTDIDNDGQPNVSDLDIDNDGKPNVSDTDIDGDNIPNTEDNDLDGDNVDNIDDNDIDGDGIPNTQDSDIDGDGKTNTSDDDIDGDGIPNIDDNDIDGDGIPNTQDSDLDGDGVANDRDSDLDGDGITNSEDKDIDGDGILNTDDPDIDNDGIPNDQDETSGGTGNDTEGTQGDANTGTDTDTGTTNTDTDQNTGETGDDDYVSGIGIVAVDTVSYSFTINAGQGKGTVTRKETIDLDKVRDEIEKNDIALSTFSLTDLSISAVSNSFVQANSDVRIVIKVSYFDESNTPLLVLESAATEGLAGPVLTIGDLANGVRLNQEIFGSAAGFNSFTGMVKNESISSVSTVIEITFLDDPLQGGGTLDVDFILRASGKRPL
ncbi:MAG: hypothetical protein JXA18_02390 [Chitinispirillaceae bacterium]|nr:hypothetical protein [Chitinispirillaceae bacterium]